MSSGTAKRTPLRGSPSGVRRGQVEGQDFPALLLQPPAQGAAEESGGADDGCFHSRTKGARGLR